MNNNTIAQQTRRKGRRPFFGALLESNITLVLAVALVIAGVSTMLNPPLSGQREMPLAQSDPMAMLAGGVPGTDGYTDRLVTQLQERAREMPGDSRTYAQLGVAYMQKSRETNDPAFYAQAESAFRKALELDAKSYEAMSGIGSLELSKHNFVEALEWGRKAQTLKPASAFAYGVMGDAYIELGKYTEAVDMFQQMVDLRPDLASYSRVSYARELHGDVEGAIDAMRMAVSAGGLTAENTAWCRVQLGNLYFNSNRLAEAEKYYDEALQGYPGYLHAYAALGQVRWAQGKVDEAIALYKQAVSEVPLPHYVAALGDLYKVAGDEKSANEQYDLALFIYETQESGGVDVAIEKAMFLADRDLKPEEAVKLAQRAAESRQDINTLDALAWSLHKTGRHGEALKEMEKAMRLGTKSATFTYHIGMIYGALGDDARAREHVGKALATNPSFSILHSAQAREYMEVAR
jgi:tetratricopeptide (TPR) repeat protein